MPVSGCVSIEQTYVGSVLAGTQVNLRITVTAADEGVTGLLKVVASVNAGMEVVAVNERDWRCQKERSRLICVRDVTPGEPRTYPPLLATFNLAPEACPTVRVESKVWLVSTAGEFPQAGSAPEAAVSGCLATSMPAVKFSPTPPGSRRVINLTIRATDPLVSSISVLTDPPFESVGNCLSLTPGSPCFVQVAFNPTCLGSRFSTLRAFTNLGSSFSIPLSGSAMPNEIVFQVVDKKSSEIVRDTLLSPDTEYSIGVKLDPELHTACEQHPTMELISFQPSNGSPGGQFYDIDLARDGKTLLSGTVAGFLKLQASLLFISVIEPLKGKNELTLQVTSRTPVIRKATIENRTHSSFQVNIVGFSTFRETGDDAKTEACLTILPAAGAKVDTSPQLCALKDDFRIWYERSVSVGKGSQFQATMTASYSGDINAIGLVKVIVRNRLGDSRPYCIDFKAGDKEAPCP